MMPTSKVDASAVREHLLVLQRRGLGTRAVADACDVSKNTVHNIRNGALKSIRALTAERILSVTPAAIADGAKVSRSATRRYLDQLLEEGFTRKQIAAALGYTKLNLLYRKRFTARTASRVLRFYRRVQKEGSNAASV